MAGCLIDLRPAVGAGSLTVAGYVYDFDGFRIGIRIPYGRAYNPENNEGWEGVGVTPDIDVPSPEALTAAHADALRRLIEAEDDAEYRVSLEWGLVDLESRLSPISVSSERLEMYVGQYGPRRIFLEGGALFYQREDRPAYALEPMGEGLFRVGNLGYSRLSFGHDATGEVV